MDQRSPNDLLRSIFNHVVLPHRIPNGEDDDSVISQELARRSIQAAQSIRDYADGQDFFEWERLSLGLKTSQVLNAEGYLNKARLLNELRELQSGRAVILHVSNQNAGILVYRPAWFVTAKLT